MLVEPTFFFFYVQISFRFSLQYNTDHVSSPSLNCIHFIFKHKIFFSGFEDKLIGIWSYSLLHILNMITGDLVKIRDHHDKERRNCGVKAYKFNFEFPGILNNKIRLKSSCQLYRRNIKISTSNYLIFCRPTEKTAMLLQICSS